MSARVMTMQVALLRAVNVGGSQPVAMAGLTALLSQLGFEAPRSLLASGNLVFRSRSRTGARLERLLEAEAERELGLRTKFFVRSALEWGGLVAGNPFAREAERDPSHLVALLFERAPSAQRATALEGLAVEPEQLRVRGRHAYASYPNGIARSPLTNARIEKTLGARSTARNWNTVLKLAAACRD